MNNFSTIQTYSKTIKDLTNAQTFIDLIQKLVAKSDCANEFNEIQNGVLPDKIIGIRFDLIEYIFRGKLTSLNQMAPYFKLYV